MGFTMYQGHRDYRKAEDEVNIFRKFRVNFMAHTEDNIPWEF
jgi:cytochrome c oxidase assembly protein Cox11